MTRIITDEMAGKYSLRLILMSSAIVIVSTASVSRQTVVNDLGLLYPYTLLTSSHFGKIPDSALPGSEVPVDGSVAHNPDVFGEDEFLNLRLYANEYYSQPENAKLPNKTDNATTRPSEFSSLPQGVVWDINLVRQEQKEGTPERAHEGQAFTVDSFLNVVVHDPKEFADIDVVEFVVVAVRHVTDQEFEVVSNPIAIVISIEHNGPKREGAALYVGVVVLAICLFVLLIPLTVRTKRRLREGKPLCACGSSQKKMEKRMREDEGTRNDATTVQTISGGEAHVTENFGVPLYVNRPRMDSDTPRHETFQHKNLRSDSDPHFQPRWLDPHYKDVYEHPTYSSASNQAARLSLPSGGDTVLAVASTSKEDIIVERI